MQTIQNSSDKYIMGQFSSQQIVIDSNQNIDKRKEKQKIDWDDFNFPPCLKLIHFKMSELQQPQKKVIIIMLINYILIVLICFFNIINNIIQCEQFESIRVFYSFLNVFIFGFLQLFLFYRGYRGMLFDSSLLKLYKIFAFLLIILYFIFMIIDAGPFNGFSRVDKLSNIQAAQALAVIESLFYLFIVILQAYSIYQVTFEDKLESSRL